MYRRRLNFPTCPSALKSTETVSTPHLRLNFIERDGFKGFLSPHSTRLLVNSYHLHLRSVAELAFGSSATINQASKDLFRIVEAGERDEGIIRNPRLLHHASQAWNLDFFLRGLTNEKTEPSDFVLEIISKEFGSFDQFKRSFQAHASAMIGCGWIWLVKTDKETDSLDILTTFNGASPLFKSNSITQTRTNQKHFSTVKNSPILGLNLWESAFILDYSLDRDQYVRNWWKAINWNVASVLLSK